MIEYIKGELTELTPALATIEAAGIGYGLNISLNTFSAIQGKKEVKLYVYEAIREDAHLLYGFVNKKEREMFLLLITVSGVGANTARMMLSGMSVAELCNAISTGNAKLIQGIKGIGKMTAQRIIVVDRCRHLLTIRLRMRLLPPLLCLVSPRLLPRRLYYRYCKHNPMLL